MSWSTAKARSSHYWLQETEISIPMKFRMKSDFIWSFQWNFHRKTALPSFRGYRDMSSFTFFVFVFVCLFFFFDLQISSPNGGGAHTNLLFNRNESWWSINLRWKLVLIFYNLQIMMFLWSSILSFLCVTLIECSSQNISCLSAGKASFLRSLLCKPSSQSAIHGFNERVKMKLII